MSKLKPFHFFSGFSLQETCDFSGIQTFIFLIIVTFKKNADLVIFEIPPNRHLSLQIATDFAPNRHIFWVNQCEKKST